MEDGIAGIGTRSEKKSKQGFPGEYVTICLPCFLTLCSQSIASKNLPRKEITHIIRPISVWLESSVAGPLDEVTFSVLPQRWQMPRWETIAGAGALLLSPIWFYSHLPPYLFPIRMWDNGLHQRGTIVYPSVDTIGSIGTPFLIWPVLCHRCMVSVRSLGDDRSQTRERVGWDDNQCKGLCPIHMTQIPVSWVKHETLILEAIYEASITWCIDRFAGTSQQRNQTWSC